MACIPHKTSIVWRNCFLLIRRSLVLAQVEEPMISGYMLKRVAPLHFSHWISDLSICNALIQKPDVAHASTLASDLSCVLATKLFTPGSNTFIWENNAPLGHHKFHIPKTQGKPKVQPNALADDCRWVAVALAGYWWNGAHRLDSRRWMGVNLTMPPKPVWRRQVLQKKFPIMVNNVVVYIYIQ